MRYFFLSSGDYLGAFDDGALSKVPSDAIEVQQAPTHGLDRLVNGVIVPYAPNKPLLERLTSVVNTLGAETQAQFGGVIAPVYVALVNGRSDVGRLIIQNAQVPTKMEPVRQTLLAEFDK